MAAYEYWCYPTRVGTETQAEGAPRLLLRRAGILGDVHAEDRLLDAALDFLARQPDLDALLCTGDLVTGPGSAGRCLERLAAENVLCVRGNHDRWFVEAERRQAGVGYDALPHATPEEDVSAGARAFLAGLPVTRTFLTPAGPLLLCHGTDTDDMTGVYPGDTEAVLSANYKLYRLYAEDVYRVVVAGHTHQRMVRAFDHLTLVNAGTLRRDCAPGFLLADFTARVLHTYDLSPATGEIVGERTVPLP